jgi:hypothetical protein
MIEPVVNRARDLVHGVRRHLREPRQQAIDHLSDQSIFFGRDNHAEDVAATSSIPQAQRTTSATQSTAGDRQFAKCDAQVEGRVGTTVHLYLQETLTFLVYTAEASVALTP